MTDWNARYRHNDTPWDRGAATPVLDEMLARHPAVFRGHVLSPGCGAGHDARKLAEAGCRVEGWDIAPLAVERARAADPGNTVVFRIADFLAEGEERFDLIWEHTCFCAIDPLSRAAYIRAASRRLVPQGKIAAVFFINPEREEGEEGPPFGIGVDEFEALWTSAGFRILDSWLPASSYPGREGRERAMILEKT